MHPKVNAIVPACMRGYTFQERKLALGHGNVAHPRETNADDEMVEPDKEDMTIPILLTCKQWCLDASAMLYEENTFEVHIHNSGVDFLDLPRIPHLQDLATALQSGKDRFGKDNIWSFNRIRHFRFVFWAGSPSERLASSNMRASMEKIVDMIMERDEPPISIDVRFLTGAPGTGSINVVDAKGNLWVDTTGTTYNQVLGIKNGTVKARGSIMHGVSNLELASSPLRKLRGVSSLDFVLPDFVADPDSKAYAAELVSLVTGSKSAATAPQEKKASDMVAIHSMIKARELSRFEGETLEEFAALQYANCLTPKRLARRANRKVKPSQRMA